MLQWFSLEIFCFCFTKKEEKTLWKSRHIFTFTIFQIRTRSDSPYYSTFDVTLICMWKLRPSSHRYSSLLLRLAKGWWRHPRKSRRGLRIISHMVGALIDEHSLVPEMEGCQRRYWEISWMKLVVLCAVFAVDRSELETLFCHFHNTHWIVQLGFIEVVKQQDARCRGAVDHILSANR